MKYIKKFENRQKIAYWLVATDERLENTLVNLYKTYTKWESPIDPIDNALGLAHFIRLNFKDKYVYITLNTTTVDFNAFGYTQYSEDERKNLDNYHYLGTIDISEEELSANKYNL